MGSEWVTGLAQVYVGWAQAGGHPSNLVYMPVFQAGEQIYNFSESQAAL
jgi:hypothetical protein